ncbi:MAG: hypothetical protein R3D62_13735 [Xanthobacteraceae bacterium]
MAREPEDAVLRILKNIQLTLSEHTKRFDNMAPRFDRIDRRMEEVHERMITSLGLASHAHVRQNGIQKELDD